MSEWLKSLNDGGVIATIALFVAITAVFLSSLEQVMRRIRRTVGIWTIRRKPWTRCRLFKQHAWIKFHSPTGTVQILGCEVCGKSTE